MSTRRYESREEAPSERSRCMSCLCVSWKVFTCIFSHVTLIAMVVAYCILGAVTFEHLESANEKLVSKNLKKKFVRYNRVTLNGIFMSNFNENRCC